MNNTQKSLKRTKLRNNEYYDIQHMFDKLYSKSCKNLPFKDLYSYVIDDKNIKLAYRNIKKNTGSKTKGCDGKTITSLGEMNESEILDMVKSKLSNYMPKKVKRVEIPKPDGSFRPLGIPSISDRLIQQCILQVLEPVCEAKFFKHSYGFRPNRSAKDAVARSYHLAQSSNLHYVVNVDIKGFFDNINHGKLLKQLWSLGIRDKKIISIISKMLKAEIDGIGIPSKGTPQGGIISPLLANVTLNELDWWITSQWDNIPTRHNYKEDNGSKYPKYAALRKTRLKEMHIVRYADDFKIFCRNKSTAIKVFAATQKWLKERLKLEVNIDKSGIVNLKNNFTEFLGVKIKVNKKGIENNGKPKYVVKSHINDKAKKKMINHIKKKVKSLQKVNTNYYVIDEYNSAVLGWHNYYNMATHCNKDFNKISYHTRSTIRNRLGKHLKKVKSSDSIPNYIKNKYGKSELLRRFHSKYLIPISFVQHKTLLCNKQLSQYVKEDREKIHDNLKVVDYKKIQRLIENPIINKSIEYNDNRISKFIAQNGKCYITQTELEIEYMDCHHIKPSYMKGTDQYQNLVILHSDIHKTIHASKMETIIKYLMRYKLDKNQVEKINLLRIKAQNEPISDGIFEMLAINI